MDNITLTKPTVAAVDLPKSLYVTKFNQRPWGLLEYPDCLVARGADRELAYCFLRIAILPRLKLQIFPHWESAENASEKVAVLKAVINTLRQSAVVLEFKSVLLFESELAAVERELVTMIDKTVDADMREVADDRLQAAFFTID